MKEKRLNRLALLAVALVVLAAILLSGCATQSRCFALFPPDTVTRVETETVTQWKDTTVFVRIVSDSIFVNDYMTVDYTPPTIDAPIQVIPTITIRPLTARLPLAHSRAWVEDGRLNLGLWIDSTTLRFKLDSAIATVTTTETITETLIVEKPVKEKWPRILMWVFAGAAFIMLILAVVFFKLK